MLTTVHDTGARIAAGVFLAGLGLCFGVSAAYHSRAWSQRLHDRWQRADHAAIFLLIAGTFTPVVWRLTQGGVRTALLGGVWFAALTGLMLKLLHRAWRVATAMYLVLGWLALPLLPWLWSRFGAPVVLLLLLGGVLYTVGAVLFLQRRPFPNAHHFGFHEVWHAFTLAAAGAHLAAIFVLLP